MPERVVLDNELRCDGGAEAQREGRRLIQLFIRERAYCVDRSLTVPAQEFERGLFCYLRLLPGMPGI